MTTDKQNDASFSVDEADALRNPQSMFLPDPRTKLFAKRDEKTGALSSYETKDQFENIAEFQLHVTVPEDIRIYFETAKNLYLYAWCVFRFYPLAEQQVFSALEFSLRERQKVFVDEYVSKHRFNQEPGLYLLLKEAINKKLISNERFPSRERWAYLRASERYRFEQFQRMQNENKEILVFDETKIIVLADDLNHDWLGVFLETIPKIRNEHAHGSSMLYHTVLRSFEIVTQIINQLYPLRNN